MRDIIIVLDSVGIGELPDAMDYGDLGSNTLLNIKKALPSLNLPNMLNMGLSNIDGLSSLSDGKTYNPTGAFARLGEKSKGKDTTTGHWEIAGLITRNPFPTYPNGFPDEIIEAFKEKTGREVLGNCTASGTEIIQRLGDEHVKTGALIVYTSADSVFQIAAHEDVVPVSELYRICGIARDMLTGEHAVSRVIARPFVGESGHYTRTTNRHDFSLKPTGKTMLDYISQSKKGVYGVGKIYDIFCGVGVDETVHIENNMDGVNKTLEFMSKVKEGLIFTNLVDFDMVFGHRNDVSGYAKALEEFDGRLPEIISKLKDDDILYITADHGCDPTTVSTDHSREYVPLLVYGKAVKPGVNLGTRDSFSDIAATVTAHLDVKGDIEVEGKSFLREIKL
ncbi:MAG: phosphopentomutase [Clostridiales bacterium]|jgi:phosphopentomutase|nr:phosphopentomutase [Clostridiales bacterium]